MPRLPDRVVSRLQPASSQGSRLSSNELASLSAAEARTVARQAIDAVETPAGLNALATRLQGEPVPSPLSSLAELPAGQAWLAGGRTIGATSTPDDIKLVQRALMKIGAHHPQGRTHPELMLLPWGADGSLGQGTRRALDVALRLAGRPQLVPVSLPLSREVARALEGLLQATPKVALPPQREVYPTAVPQRLNVFGGVALPIAATPLDAKWKSALARLDAERPRLVAGHPELGAEAAVWLRGVEALRGKPALEQLAGVNRLVNEVPYLADAQDEWKTPLVFFAQRGDCEDYALAKYASLRLLGIDESRMRLLIVNDTVTRQAHAVLAVDLPEGTFILDNLNREVKPHEALRFPSTGEWHYQPVFALSRTRQWLYGRPATPG